MEGENFLFIKLEGLEIKDKGDKNNNYKRKRNFCVVRTIRFY